MLISDYIFPKRSAHSFRRTVSSRDTVNEKFLILKLKTCVPVNLRPNSRVQVPPLARPVNRGVFRVRPVPSAVPISKAASGAPDADRWAAEEGHASFHGGANQNHPPMRYTHARKRPSEPSERDRGVNRFTFENEKSRPNHETYTEASIVLHLKTKNPVRTIRHTQRRQSLYT